MCPNKTSWTSCKLGDVLELKRGYDLPKSKRTEGKVPIISSSGESGTHNEAKVKAPGVVTGRYGTLGEVFYVERDFWPLNTALYVKDFKGNNPRFISYLLTQLNFSGQNVAGAVPGVNRNYLHMLDVTVPPVHEQKKIASVLETYDNLIENNNRRIAILEEMAQSLYREWFVKFRFPGHENAKFIDSPLGKIPEGWEIKTLSDVINIDRGRSYRSKELVEEGGYPFLNLKNVAREGGFRRDGLKRYDGPFKPHHIAKPNDIIMAVTDMTQERAIIARPARVPNMGIDEFVFSMDLVKITVKEGYEESFVYSLLRYSDFPHVVKQYANGANVLHLSPKVIEAYEALIPSNSVRVQFSEAIRPIHSIQDKLERKNDNLKRQRDMLLPKLISGKIGV